MFRLRNDVLTAALMGLFSGVLSAALFISPYSGSISLSELVLQLSGSRGTFELNPTLSEIMEMYTRFIPMFFFEIYAGTVMYRSFCTASVYVFARNPSRARWYWWEAAHVLLLSSLFTAVSLISAVLYSAVQYDVSVNVPGVYLGVFHFVLFAIWTFTVTIALNLLSVLFGTHVASLIAIGVQAACIALLSLIRLEDQILAAVLLQINPIAHLVLGWFHSGIPALDEAIASSHRGFSFVPSLLVVSAYCLITVLYGRQFILHRDILSNNAELDGV